MRFLVIIIFLSSIKLFSQEIEYQLYLKNTCNDSIEKSINYSLEKDGKVYDIADFDNPIIKVPENGKYKLISRGSREKYFVEITINNFKDTLTLPSIRMYFILHPPSYKKSISESELMKIRLKNRHIFKNCGLPINGNKIDYFTDNNIRLSGTFKNGYAMGEIKEYYQNGKIKEISYYDNIGLLIKMVRYDINGTEIKN